MEFSKYDEINRELFIALLDKILLKTRSWPVSPIIKFRAELESNLLGYIYEIDIAVKQSFLCGVCASGNVLEVKRAIITLGSLINLPDEV